MKIKLTIITVTYNCEKTLQRTIDSILNQNFDSYEYLIIDGGSSDGTLSIIKKNMDKFKGKLRYISESDNGLYDAMNKGIDLAKGEYVGIINGDDYYKENAFNEVVRNFKDKDVDIIYSDLLFTLFNKIDYKNPLKADYRDLKNRMSVNHPTCFVKKDIYLKYGKFNLDFKIAADYEIMARFYTKGCKFKKSKNVLAVMELGGLSSNNPNSIYEKYCIHKMYFGNIHALRNKIKNILIYIYRKNKQKYGVKK